VQVTQCKRYLSSVKLSFVFRKTLAVCQMLEQLAPLDKVHYEIDAVLFLENEVKADDKRVVYLQQNQFLQR